MVHPAIEAVERYYALFNRKDWPGVARMFDVPAAVIRGARKVVLNDGDAVVALYRSIGERLAQEGAVRLVWDRGSFSLFQVHDDLAVVKTVLTRETQARVPIKTWNCSYTLRRVGADWQFALVTSDETVAPSPGGR